jgi:hypothetical protein
MKLCLHAKLKRAVPPAAKLNETDSIADITASHQFEYDCKTHQFFTIPNFEPQYGDKDDDISYEVNEISFSNPNLNIPCEHRNTNIRRVNANINNFLNIDNPQKGRISVNKLMNDSQEVTIENLGAFNIVF